MPDEAEAQELHGISRYRDRIVNGPIVRTFFWLGFPPLLTQLVIVAYNLADTFWLSSYSELAAAVPRQMLPIIMLFQALVTALTTACVSMVSQYVGARAYRKASLEASRFFTLVFFTGGALSLFLLLLRSFIFTQLMFTPPEILDYVMAYSGIIAVSIFFEHMAFTCSTVLQSLGDTKLPALINVAAVTFNAVLDPFLILGIGPFPRLGVVGAALTNLTGKIMAIVGHIYVLKKSYPELKMRFTRNIDAAWAKLVLRIGLPIFTLGLMNGFAFLITVRLVNMLGITATMAFSIGFVIMSAVEAAPFGLSGASAIMIGQSLGADDPKRAREISLKSALLIFTIMAAGASLLYPIKHAIVDVFADDSSILSEANLFLQILVPTQPFFGLFMNAMATGRGSGHTIFPTAIDIARLWGITITLGYSLAFILGMGSLGIWLTFALSNIIGGTMAIIWVKYGKWNRAVVKKSPV